MVEYASQKNEKHLFFAAPAAETVLFFSTFFQWGDGTLRMRKKKNLDTRMAHCSPWLVQTPEDHKGRWRELMVQRTDCPLYLEIGCGKGRFTVETAATAPDALYIAIERVADAMVIAMERARAQELDSVFFLDEDASRLPDLFSLREVDRIYINFCDPWPSNKHARRRLTHTGFLSIYWQLLKPGGEIHFKTDNQDLFEYSLFQFPKEGFTLKDVTRDLHGQDICGIMTDYEEKFYNEGLSINRCVAVKTEKSS